MATTVFSAQVAANRQATVVTGGGSATNNVSTSNSAQVNPVGTASSHNGIARNSAGGVVAPTDIHTMIDVSISTSINTNLNTAKSEKTTGLDESALATNNFIVRYDGLFVDSTNTLYTAASVSSVAGTDVTWNTQSIGSFITGFTGSTPAVNAY